MEVTLTVTKEKVTSNFVKYTLNDGFIVTLYVPKDKLPTPPNTLQITVG